MPSTLGRARREVRVNLLSEETMRNLLDFLEYLDRKSVGDCQDMVMLWFHEPAAREIIQQHLDAVATGRICRRPGSPDHSPIFDVFCPPEKSQADPGDRPGAVPGLLFWLRREFRRQIAMLQDELRTKGQDLDVHGNRKAKVRYPRNRFRAFAIDVFVQELKAGETALVTGPRGGGKTQFSLNHLAAPWIAGGGVVVSNIEVFDPPQGYIKVEAMDRAIVACIDAKIEKKQVLVLIDEGNINRGRANAQRRENKVMKDNSTWARKIGCAEAYIYQRDQDVARELEDWARFYYRKFSQDERTRVFCDTPVLEGVVIDDLPDNRWLREHHRPCLDFNTDDPAPYDANVDIASVVRAIFSTPPPEDGSPRPDWLLEVRRQIKDAIYGPKISKPLDLEQLHWLICAMHRRDTQAKPISYVHLFEAHFSANGYKDKDDAKAVIMDQWKIAAHPDVMSRWCTFCRQSRGGIKIEAAEPPGELDVPNASA